MEPGTAPGPDRTGAPSPRPEDLQYIDNVLADQPAWTAAADRRRLLTGLAAGGVGLAALALSSPVFAAAAGDSNQAILDIADTAEHLAVTYLGYVLAMAKGLPAAAVPILRAARYEEQVHLQVLEGLGAKPLTTSFSLPGGDLTYVTDGTKALQTIELAEGLFVAAYLAAVGDFASRGSWRFAQYAAEIMGVEAEHRTLARLALAQVPADNLAFEAAAVPSVGAAAGKLAALGFLSPRPGNSYAYPGPGTYAQAIAEINAGGVGVSGTTPTSSTPPPGGAR